MAEPTDPAALAALEAYDDASHALSDLQDNLPDPDLEGAVDAWVTNAQLQWQIAARNWEAAGVTDRAWRRVEQTFMKILPEVREKSLRTAFVEYNELAERAMQFDFDVVPLPIPKSLKQRGTSSSQRAGSRVASSPTHTRQKSLVPPSNISHHTTPASQTPKPPVLPADPPRTVSPMPVPPKSASPPTTPPPTKPSSVAPPSPKHAVSSRTSDLTVEVPKLNYSTATSPHASSSLEKTQTKLTTFLRPKPPPPPAYAAFTGLQVPAGGNNSGWGSPAWSPISLTDDTPSSPSGGYVFFPPDQTSSLHYGRGPPFKIGPPSNATHTEKPTRPLRVVDAATRPTVLLGPDPTRRKGSVPSPPPSRKPLFYPGTDDEEEQSRGVMVNEEPVEESGGEGSVSQGQDDDAPTPPMGGPMDIDGDKGQQSDDAPSPPPTQSHRKTHRISFVFDDVTGDFEDPHPTIFLPRRPAPQEQSPRRSTRPHVSPVDQDAAYFKATQESKPSRVKKDKKKHAESLSKKAAKGKEKEASSLKRSRDDDDTAPAVDKPATKKLKAADTKVAGAEAVRATPAFQKRGPAPSKPPAVSMGISGGGFGEKVPSTAKPIKDGLKNIGVLVVKEDYGKFVNVDGRYWNKEVAPFVGERYTEPCDTCRRRSTHCRKLLTHTVICVRCHYAKQPCEVDGEVALNPVLHYRPQGYKAINTFESALNAIEVNNATITSLTQQFLAGLNVLSHTESIRVQSSRLRECLNPVEEVVEEEDDSEVEEVIEEVAGPSKKKAKSG
ncbi:uncharacterized protein ARMOST_11554 [Armillaria ostoyae]|uniref:Zn(2)-C6 fungal-type domain-containing protein n=1 Tax=Armillaria ostoyae TaxID=47428 RepID=A0A284RHG4_ARMOS|nr:uncharacterized protein ARMOST_11554 [Armillaria ostoyae]